MTQHVCEICGRPATVTVRRIVPGQPARLEYLCDTHAAEARQSASFGSGLFDDFFERFFGDTLGGRLERASEPPTRRRASEQVDITRLFSEATNEQLQRAAQQAMQWGRQQLEVTVLAD